MRHTQTHSDREAPRCPESWWTTVPYGQQTAKARQELPRMQSRGVSYWADLGGEVRSGPKPLSGSMRGD